MELKVDSVSEWWEGVDRFYSHLYGIESSQCRQPRNGPRRFTRTFMELKVTSGLRGLLALGGFTRTFMELKV